MFSNSVLFESKKIIVFFTVLVFALPNTVIAGPESVPVTIDIAPALMAAQSRVIASATDAALITVLTATGIGGTFAATYGTCKEKRNAQYVGTAMIAGSIGGLALFKYLNK